MTLDPVVGWGSWSCMDRGAKISDLATRWWGSPVFFLCGVSYLPRDSFHSIAHVLTAQRWHVWGMLWILYVVQK